MSTNVNFEFKVKNDNTIIVTDYTGHDEVVEIPSTIDGKTVTEIGEWSFADCDWMTSVTIPDSVTSIGGWAFNGCTALSNITIGHSVIFIGNAAFCDTGYDNNPSNWENGVLYIGKYLISATPSITGNYTVKDGTRLIAECSFWGCTGLTGVTVPGSVTYINNYAFRYCPNLTTLIISDGVEYIGFGIDLDCDKLGRVSLPSSVKKVGNAVVTNL